MGLTTTFLMAIGLAMDAFAASIADGAMASRHRISRAVQLAVVFAVFQAAMALIGWAIGRGFAGPIQDVDHWVAFGLLGIIGLRMIHADMTPSDTDVRPDGWQSLILVALATSIDALAAGLSLTFLDSIITPVVVMGS